MVRSFKASGCILVALLVGCAAAQEVEPQLPPQVDPPPQIQQPPQIQETPEIKVAPPIELPIQQVVPDVRSLQAPGSGTPGGCSIEPCAAPEHPHPPEKDLDQLR